MKRIIYLLMIPLIMISCGQKSSDDHGHDHSAEGAHDHGDTHDHGLAVKVTMYTDSYELYAEMGDTFVGESIQVLAHLTSLENHQPVDNANFYIKFYNARGKNVLTTKGFTKEKAGIYSGAFRIGKEGDFKVEFVMQDGNKIARFTKKIHFKPHSHDGEAVAHADEGINFSKEKAWEMDFTTAKVELKDFNYTVRTSGELLPARGSFQGITAKSSGIIHFTKPSLDDGTSIKSGEVLFSISGEGLSENNIENRFIVVSSEYERSKANYLRKQKLFEEKIVSARDFEECKAQYRIDSSKYYNLLEKYNVNGIQISAPISGNIYELGVSDGDYVQEGQTIAHIIDNNKMRINADVPQRHFALINDIKSLNFKTAYSDEIFSLEDVNGRLLTRGSFADQNSGFIPVIFEIENNGLLAGSFVECWLKTNPIPNRLVIPKSSLIEEQGSYFVYVQTSGETYEKRYVKFNVADGKDVWITEGLREGERIVSKGAMIIKVASAAGTMPVHSHEH